MTFRHTPAVRARRSLTTLLAGAAGIATVAGLAAVVPAAVAAPACTRIAREPAPAVDLVSRRSEVPVQKGGSRVTAAVRGAVGDELAAERAGELSEADGALWLDTCGQAFYVEPTSSAVAQTEGVVDTETQGTNQQLFPLADTFDLSSRPGSQRTIYLDFTGHSLTGTSWNGNYGWGSSASLDAYDFEGGAGTFTTAERINIQNVWAMVSEDYAPFDVNVTTADPGAAAIARSGSSDEVYGTRAVVTNDATGQSACGCGGIAFIGVFNNASSHATYQPALVFTRGVGHGAKNVSEALSHEVGHNLGLVHQGVAGGAGYYSGHGSWAPIMGVGYYKPVSQWARGQYANPSSTQDELASITALGLPYVADDHGDGVGDATALSGALSAGVTASGVIATSADVDTFEVTVASAGDLTVAASPAAVGADLDLRMIVRDSAGALVADVDPVSTSSFIDRADNLDARVTLTGVAAGTYYVSLDGVGARNAATDGYTDYGSLGRYDLLVSASSSNAPVVTSPAPAELTTGVAYQHVLAATAVDGGAVRWTMTGTLPSGVLFNAATGTLSGKTSVKGVFPVVVTATDSQGRESSRAYTLRSAGKLLAGALTARPAATVGTGFAGQLAASGGTAPYRWTATTKPAWASVSTSGAVTGTPTTAGPEALVLTVTDAGGRAVTRPYTLTVTGPLVVRDLSGRQGGAIGGTVLAGTRFAFTVPTYGGKRSYAFTGDVVPAGLTVSASGSVAGVLAEPGTYALTVSVRDSLGARVTKTLTVRAVGRLELLGTPPEASVGDSFTATFTPRGGVAPYTVSATGVPAGLAFNAATGVLSGTPTGLATSASVVFTVTDGVGRVLSRRVPLPVRSSLLTTATSLPGASNGRSYTGRITATGGTGTFTWAIASGSLPPGLSLSTSGSISGTPTALGTWTARYTATDKEGRVGTTAPIDLVVSQPVLQTATTMPVGTVGQAYSQALSTTGGSGVFSYSSTSRFPAGLSLSSAGVVSGTPTAAATLNVSVKVTDSAGRTNLRAYTIKVVSGN